MTMAMQVVMNTKFSVALLDATNGFSAHRCKEMLINRGSREEVGRRLGGSREEVRGSREEVRGQQGGG